MVTCFGLCRPFSWRYSTNKYFANAHLWHKQILLYFALFNTSLRMAEKCRNMQQDYNMFVHYYINYSAAVGIYMISHTKFVGTNPQFHNTFRDIPYLYLQLLSVS